MMERGAFARRLGGMVEGLLHARNKTDSAFISRVADGASFEGWLCFETRHELERQRSEFGLERPTVWIGNEYRKVDLGILENVTDDHESWLAAIEFKLVYNNKNWVKKCDEIWADLQPSSGTKKAALRPTIRLAFVAVVRADFLGNPYQRAQDRAADWEERFRAYLLPETGPYARQVTSLWKSSRRFLLPDSRWLNAKPQAPHTLHFEILALDDQSAPGAGPASSS